MKRPTYAEAIRWIVINDDIEFLFDAEPILSVTGSLVADLFGKTDKQVLASIRAEFIKYRESRPLSRWRAA